MEMAVVALVVVALVVMAGPAGAGGMRVTRTPKRIEMDNGLMAVAFARGKQGIALERLADSNQGVELLAPAEGDE